MHMVYHSDNFVVVQFDTTQGASAGREESLMRGGYEIVDKFARKEIFIEGALAESFKQGVEALIETSPTEEEMDDYLERFSPLMQHPLVLH